MDNPLISIIVPIYKVELYLDECVESLIKQTYSNIEIILVDDGSPDLCPQMCDEWAKKDDRIVVVHKSNGGLSDARNAGIDVANGEFIGFVDSDDFVDVRMYEHLLEGFSIDEDVAVTSIKVLKYTEGSTSIFDSKWNISKIRRIEGFDFAAKMISQQCCFTAWNKLYRCDIIKDVRFRKGRNNEDTLFMFDLGKVMKSSGMALMEMPYAAYYYRIRPESICTTSKKPLVIDAIQNLEDMMLECRDDDNSLYYVLFERYGMCLYVFCDSLLLQPERMKLYFKIYQAKLKSIPYKTFLSRYKGKDFIYIFLLRNFPYIRYLIRKVNT